MSIIKRDFIKILSAGVIAVFLCLFLHELGHCIAIWFYGGRITEFQLLPWDAHVSYEGDGVIWKPLVNLAGIFLSTLIAFILLFTYHKAFEGTFVYYLKIIYIIVNISSLFPWITGGLLYLKGGYPGLTGSDVQKFIMNSGIPPIAVAYTTMVVILLMVVIFIIRIMASASSQWQKKNIRNMGIWLGGCLAVTMFLFPFFLRLDAKQEAGGTFSVTEKNGSTASILKKQFDVTIEEKGTYVFNIYWGGEGFITGVILSQGEQPVFHCTAEKITMESLPKEFESGTYTFSVYCLDSMEDWEEFFNIVGTEAPEANYNFQNVDKYSVYGGYEFIRSF